MLRCRRRIFQILPLINTLLEVCIGLQGLQLGRPRQALCLGFFSRAKGFFSALIFFRGMRFRDGKPARIPATEPGPEILALRPVHRFGPEPAPELEKENAHRPFGAEVESSLNHWLLHDGGPKKGAA